MEREEKNRKKRKEKRRIEGKFTRERVRSEPVKPVKPRYPFDFPIQLGWGRGQTHFEFDYQTNRESHLKTN